MSTPIEVRSLDRLPKDGCLIVPGRLDANQANALASSLAGRNITWLVEETVTQNEKLQSYLQHSGHRGAAFSKIDESLLLYFILLFVLIFNSWIWKFIQKYFSSKRK